MDFLPDFFDSDDDPVDDQTSKLADNTMNIISTHNNNTENENQEGDDNNDISSNADGNINDDIDDGEEEWENSNVKVPPLAQWKEDELFSPHLITVGKGKRNIWAQAQKEAAMVKQNIIELELPSDVAGIAASHLFKVYQTLFGTSSQLYEVFHRYLKISTVDYLQFLSTYFISCKNQQSAANLHASAEINSDMLMPLSAYTGYWTAIRDIESNRRQREFWDLVEEAVNQQLRLLFISPKKTFPYLLGFDDDKLHFEYSAKSNMQGLSRQHHQKDARKGLTLHTCAYSATCVPLTVSFQRMGESVQDTYYRTMQEIFGAGTSGLPNLRGVVLASDRGYWERMILFGQMLEAGADIIGTVKRVSFCCVVLFFCCVFLFFLTYRSPVFVRSAGSPSRSTIRTSQLSQELQETSRRKAIAMLTCTTPHGEEKNIKKSLAPSPSEVAQGRRLPFLCRP